MRGRRISDDAAAILYNMRDLGHSTSSIATLSGVPLRTVQRVLQRRKPRTNKQVKRNLGAGRKSSAIQDFRLIHWVHRNRFISLQQMVRQLHLPYSKWTLRRRLLEHGIKAYLAAQDVLTNLQKRRRVEWCQHHVNDDFGKYIFSDEMVVVVSPYRTVGRLHVYRRRGEALRLDCIYTVPHVRQAGRICFWGCLSASGFGCCRTMDTTMNSDRYLETLQNYLIPSIALFTNGIHVDRLVFQQDNAPPHKAHIIRDWFETQSFSVVSWPAYSPDLNPIENVWAFMKKSLLRTRPTTIHQVRTSLVNGWNQLSPIYSTKLVKSMRARCQRVIKSRGFRVSY